MPNLNLPWKLLKLYPTVHSYLFFSSHSIVLFPLRTPTPHLKKCYVQTEALRYEGIGLSFGIGHLDIFVGLPWKRFKVIPNRFIFLFTQYCIVSTENTRKGLLSVHGGSISFKIGRSFSKGTNRLSVGYTFVDLPWKLLKLFNRTFICICFFALYCLVSTENTTTWRIAKCTRRLFKYEGIGQIQNWYVILKGDNLGFHLDINLSASLESF